MTSSDTSVADTSAAVTTPGFVRAAGLLCVGGAIIPGSFGPFLAGHPVLTVWMLMFAALGVAPLHTHPTRPAPRQGGPR
jgi:hypothetical protein